MMGMTDGEAQVAAPRFSASIDCDVTTFATHILLLRRYNRNHGTAFTSKDIKDYDYKKWPLPVSKGEFDCLYGATWIVDWPNIPVLARKETLAEFMRNFDATFTSDRPTALELPLKLALRKAYDGLNAENSVRFRANLLDFNFVFNDAPYAIDEVLAKGGYAVVIKTLFNNAQKYETHERAIVVPDIQTGLEIANRAAAILHLKTGETPIEFREFWNVMKSLSLEAPVSRQERLLRGTPEKCLSAH